MYYVYADGNLIYNQFDRSLTIHSPKVTLELGKAGSFQFDIPPTNQYYNSLTQLKTIIKVELDNKVVFYGRIFSITRNFNNIKHVYCEGALSYLIDTIQQAKSYKGKAKQLFRDIISAHNSLMAGDTEINKAFVIDRLEIEDTDVVIPGKKDKDGKYYGDEYEQTIIESIAEEWLTTYDYINNVLIEYLGGYLIYEYDSANDRNKISYISEDSFDQLIEDYTKNSRYAPEIDYGVNMLDLTEELNAEDLFTVLIPLGDEGLTIEKATNKNDYSDVRIDMVDGKPIGIAHKSSVEKYGRIVKSYVFDNVNEPNTLFTNGYKYLKAHKNIPISFTIKAVDMHFVDSAQSTIDIGQITKINSVPHDLVQYLICTKIEYDLEDASKNQYTFGNPRQSMTERYKKNKEKAKKDSNKRSRSTSGKALATAAYVAQAYADEVNENYATIKTWVEDHYAGIEEAVHFVSGNGEGLVRATKWVDEYSANAEEIIQWHGKYSESAVETIKWANDYSAGVREAISWYNEHAQGAVTTSKWVSDYGAEIKSTAEWARDNVSRFSEIRQWVNDYGAGVELMAENASNIANGIAQTKLWVDDYASKMQTNLNWSNKYVQGAYDNSATINKYMGQAKTYLDWSNGYTKGAYNNSVTITAYMGQAKTNLDWSNGYTKGAYNNSVTITNYMGQIKTYLDWSNGYAKGAYNNSVTITNYMGQVKTYLDWSNGYAKGAYNNSVTITNYMGQAKTNLDWSNGYTKGAYNNSVTINGYMGQAKTNLDWSNGYTKGAYNNSVTITNYMGQAKTNLDWSNGYVKGAYNDSVTITGYMGQIKTNLDWSNGYVSGAYNDSVTINGYAGTAKSTLSFVTKYSNAVAEVYKNVTDHSAEIDNVVKFYSDHGKNIDSYASIKQTADAAYAMAGLFASYNKKDASVSLKVDGVKSIIQLAADEVDASTVEKFIAKGLEADQVIVGKDKNVLVTSEGLEVKNRLIVTKSDSYIVCRDIYKSGTGVKNDSTSILSKSEIGKYIDKNYIKNKLKGDSYDTFTDYILEAVLKNKDVQMKDVTFNSIKLFKNAAKTWTLKEFVDDAIEKYFKDNLTDTKIKNLLRGSKSWNTYLTDIVLGGLKGKTIDCGVLKVAYEGDSTDILKVIKKKVENHTHTFEQTNIKPDTNTDFYRWGSHKHTVTINNVTYNVDTSAALNSSYWKIKVSGTTSKGTPR